MKISRGNPKTKQVESNIKFVTLVMTKIILVRIVLKLKPSFIRFNNNITHLRPKINTSTINVISSHCDSHYGIWVLKYILTNHEGPNKA
jgi:hypothetical protein